LEQRTEELQLVPSLPKWKAPEEEAMPKAYWIARVDVRDPEGYKDYVAASKLAFDRFGARFLARGGTAEAAEGTGRARNVVIEFASLQVAHDCFHSPEYQHAKSIREKFADGEIVLVEGLES
jgi:uncharacterized protein (DUF1330 family)